MEDRKRVALIAVADRQWSHVGLGKSGTGGEEGTGFGMPLLKKLVERYGGEIAIESSTSPPDQGTRVTVLLPAVKH